MAESAYAALLREHDFTPDKEAEKGVSRAMERIEQTLDLPPVKSKPRKRPPSFLIWESTTFVTDENGNEWTAQGQVDLSRFGFEDEVELVRKALDKFGDKLHENLRGGKNAN